MSQHSDLKEIHILNLPDEIFLHIFSYVNISSRKNVFQVCRRFYELMCVVERDCHPLELSYSQICNKEIRSSIVNSSREFEDLTIYHGLYAMIKNMDTYAIKNVMLKFGKRIKKFKLRRLILLESELRRILDCVPNVENLTLEDIKVINPDENISELNLYKLKKLTIMNGSICLNILNRLPKDTIREAIISIRDVDKGLQQFFNQQANIKMLEISYDKLNFDHLKLEHLKINKEYNDSELINSKFINLPLILRQQPRLRYIDFQYNLIDDEIFTAICELKNLEVAKMCVDLIMPCHVFESLKYLTHLKELQLKSDKIHECNHLHELSRMHLMIEKLTLLYKPEKISPEFFIQLSQNFRNLKQIRIFNRSISTINTILENFPNLESIVFNCHYWSEEDSLVINENLRHEKLKEIIVTDIYDDSANTTRSLLTLLNVCPNLERIMLSKLVEVYHEDLQQIVNGHPKLTHLNFEFDTFIFQDETIDLIRTVASRLQFIELKGFYGWIGFHSTQIESYLKGLFGDAFNNIRYRAFEDYQYKDEGNTFIHKGEIIMKKRNVSDWCRDVNKFDYILYPDRIEPAISLFS